MPLPGGAADKFGNRYEARWTVYCMTRVLRDMARSIRLEPPGAEWEKIEFWLDLGNGVREFHQLKRQRAESYWTIAALKAEGVLGAFWEKTREPGARFVFVSMDSAGEIRELTERARAAKDYAEYAGVFLAAAVQRGRFETVRQAWGSPSEEATFDALRRIEIQGIPEDTLRSALHMCLEPLVDGGTPEAVAATLAQFALDSIHQEVGSPAIWGCLKRAGFRPTPWAKDGTAAASLDRATDRYLATLRGSAIRGISLPRAESVAVWDALQAGARLVFLSGTAGVGKSGVVAQLIERARGEGWPVLAFRADRDFRATPNALGREVLELPGSPPAVLAGVTAKTRALLIIDQVDALSIVSGRQPQYFDCIMELINDAATNPSLHVVLVCREFDLANDNRFRALANNRPKIQVQRISEAVVLDVCKRLGVATQALTKQQLELLSLPLHLSLLADGGTGVEPLAFSTPQDLYDRYSSHKQRALRERLGRSALWYEVITATCDRMSDTELLSVPNVFHDPWRDDAEALISEGVLVRDGAIVRFFHEGFFDYSFARAFIQRGRKIEDLANGDQALFRRGQVRQLLSLERESDRAVYLRHLEAVLAGPSVRYHLKRLVFEWLTSMPTLLSEEWEIVHRVGMGSALGSEVWRLLRRSASARKLADEAGFLSRGLASDDDSHVDDVVVVLANGLASAADRAADLLQPYVGKSGSWTKRIAYVLSRGSDLARGRKIFELFVSALRDGSFVATERDVWSVFHSLADDNAEWTCEAIGTYLEWELSTAKASGKSNPFDGARRREEHAIADRVLIGLSKAIPARFVATFLPLVEQILEANQVVGEGPPWNDSVWDYPYAHDHLDFKNALLVGLIDALSLMLTTDRQAIDDVLTRLRAKPFVTLDFINLRVMTKGGAAFADAIIDFLCEFPSRLRMGYLSNRSWTSVEAIKMAALHCTPANLLRLEEAILAFYPAWELKAPHARGSAQHELLAAIPDARRSAAASARLDEWRRKFGEAPAEHPRGIEFGPIPSPIPASAADQMSDDHWLGAFAKYALDDDFIRRGALIGGADQLADQLKRVTIRDPSRFSQLAERMPDATNRTYFDAILSGLTESAADVAAMSRAIERCHRLPGRPCGRNICWLLEKHPQLPWPKEVLEAINWYATEDQDPDRELWRTKAGQSDQPYYGGDIFTAGLNSVRGAAATTIGGLIGADPQRASVHKSAVDRLVKDPLIAVRACAVVPLGRMLRFDRDYAVDRFLELIVTEEALLGTHYVQEFIGYALHTHAEKLEPVLDRMLASSLPNVQRAGGRYACAFSLIRNANDGRAERAATSTSSEVRAGAAEMLAADVEYIRKTAFEPLLIRFFSDPDQAVREEAAGCFRRTGSRLSQFEHLIAAFLESPAFAEHCGDLLHALEDQTDRLPEIAIRVCSRTLDVLGAAAGDVQTRAAFEATRVTRIVLRLYSHAAPAHRTAILDLIDRLLLVGVYGVDKAIDDIGR